MSLICMVRELGPTERSTRMQDQSRIVGSCLEQRKQGHETGMAC